MKRVIHPYFSLIIGLLGISFIICIHEFGHLLSAKYFGVRAPVFSIGFGPALLWKKIGDTTYQIAALLFGGYVQINLEDLATLPYWKKMVIMFAGILVNFIFALGTLFLILFVTRRKEPSAVVAYVVPNSPADKAGIKPGDVIDIQHAHFNSIGQLQDLINHSIGKTITLSITHDAQVKHIDITIEKHPFYGADAGYAGIVFKEDPNKRAPFLQGIKNAYKTVKLMTKSIAKSIVHIGSNKQQANIVGPIGIVQMTGHSAQQGILPYLFLLAIISLQIAFFNLLPIPFFDGGQIARYTLEALLGSTFSPQVISIINLLAIILFIMLVIHFSRSDMALLKKERQNKSKS